MSDLSDSGDENFAMAHSDSQLSMGTNDDKQLILRSEETVEEDSMNTTSITLATQYWHPHTLRPTVSQTSLDFIQDLGLQSATPWRAFSEIDLDYAQLMGHDFYYSQQTLTTTFRCTPVPKSLSAFQRLPPELKNKIFELLDPCTSTCLGLTCRNFYSIHRLFHPTTYICLPLGYPSRLQLWSCLETWMADQGFRFRLLPDGSEEGYFRKGRWRNEPVERYKEQGMNERWRTWCARTRKWVYDRNVLPGVGGVACRLPLWRRVLVDVEDEVVSLGDDWGGPHWWEEEGF